MKHKYLTILSALLLIWQGTNLSAEDGHDHDHDHAEEQVAKETHVEGDDHSDHDHEGHSMEEKASDDELVIELTPEAVQLAGISILTIQNLRIGKTIDLPGEIGFNEDRVAHISPRFAGIAQNANFRVGDYVNKGEIVAVVESNESMNSYSIKAPISGWVIERHITSGEFVSQENSIFVIADLSTVWVNLAVYPKDADRVKKGQIAELKVIGSKTTTVGTIEYVTPIMDLQTRSLTARITLNNPENKWRPGSFVQATITTSSGSETLVVEKDAVQYLDEKSVLFIVQSANRFKPVEVKTGDSDHKYIQVLTELKPGTKYVSGGAFELKAKIVTSNLDAHAGHGH